MWQKELSSPVVAVFLLGSDGLLSVPFTTVSDDALNSIIDYARDGQKNDIKLLYVLKKKSKHSHTHIMITVQHSPFSNLFLMFILRIFASVAGEYKKYVCVPEIRLLVVVYTYIFNTLSNIQHVN